MKKGIHYIKRNFKLMFFTPNQKTENIVAFETKASSRILNYIYMREFILERATATPSIAFAILFLAAISCLFSADYFL